MAFTGPRACPPISRGDEPRLFFVTTAGSSQRGIWTEPGWKGRFCVKNLVDTRNKTCGCK